jgi:hypothetical protein
MNVARAIETFCHYSPQERTHFLIQFAHALTILARDTYAVAEEGLTNPSRLRIINELQHRVTSFLITLTKNEVKRYPDDVLLRIMLEHPEDPDLQRQLQETCSQLIDRMAAAS